MKALRETYQAWSHFAQKRKLITHLFNQMNTKKLSQKSFEVFTFWRDRAYWSQLLRERVNPYLLKRDSLFKYNSYAKLKSYMTFKKDQRMMLDRSRSLYATNLVLKVI